jgi:hypothetical protein
MNSIKSPILNKKLKIFSLISLLFLLLNACSPAAATATPLVVESTPTEVLPIITTEPATTPTEAPTSEPVEESIFPYFLPHATKLENVSQSINGVTTKIDWAYADESRVAIAYTISGLDWSDGSMMDGTLQVQMSIPAISSYRSGGFSGGGGANVSFASGGVITASSDQYLLDGALDAEKYPEINLNVDIPVEGPTKVGTFHFNFNVPVLNGFKLENIDQMVTANNVAMTLKSLSVSPSHAEALICFQMPSAVDWGLTTSRITVGGGEYPFSSGDLASDVNDTGSAATSAERCNNVGFDIIFDESITFITLTVPRLQASVSEVVTKEVVNRANQRLADKGIQFDYVNVDHGGNIVMLKQPAGLSEGEIHTLIWDAMAEQYEGPWVFTVDLAK